jgi:hypothetical protein
VAGLEFVCGLPGLISFALIPLSLLAYALAAVTFLVSAVVLGVRRRPRKAGSVIFALLAPILLWAPINWTADCLHLALTARFGVGYIGPSPNRDLPFQTYDWSTGLAGGPATFLIRDETDDIALPLSMHKHPDVLEYGFGERCSGKVKHLLSHYYVCTF